MQRILLVMKRKPVAQSLVERLGEETDVRCCAGFDYEEAVDMAAEVDANVVLVEVSESDLYNVEYCLKLCRRIRKQLEHCKFLLLCPEQNSDSVMESINAKATGRIDDFAFYEASADYLIAKLISL